MCKILGMWKDLRGGVDILMRLLISGTDLDT